MNQYTCICTKAILLRWRSFKYWNAWTYIFLRGFFYVGFLFFLISNIRILPKEHIVWAYWSEFVSNLQAAYQENSKMGQWVKNNIIFRLRWFIYEFNIKDFVDLCMDVFLSLFVLQKLQFNGIRYGAISVGINVYINCKSMLQ